MNFRTQHRNLQLCNTDALEPWPTCHCHEVLFNLQPSPPRKGVERGPGWEVQGGKTTMARGGRHGEEGGAPCSAEQRREGSGESRLEGGGGE
jgi:hypothetical protein